MQEIATRRRFFFFFRFGSGNSPLLSRSVNPRHDLVVVNIKVLRNLVVINLREEQINVHPAEVEGHDGHEALAERDKVGDLRVGADLLGERVEEVLAVADAGRDANRVDVGSGLVDRQAVGPGGVDAAAGGPGKVEGLALLQAHLLDPSGEEGL